jgi:hypothetical protein
MRSTIVLLAVLMLTATTAGADDHVCPCVPISHIWIALPCDTWDCALSALVVGGSDGQVMALPTTSDSHKWVVLQRVVSGSVAVSPDNPFLIETFPNMTDGSARFSALDHNAAPLLVTAKTGDIIVVSLRQPEPKRRAAGH